MVNWFWVHMNYADHPERERIIEQALDASTLAEIEAASREIKDWMTGHPDDRSIVDCFERMALIRNALEEEVKKRGSRRVARVPAASRK